jgi:hypothetical protein
MRVGTVTDHFAASKADYEGGDYSPEAEAAVRACERNRAELARHGTSPSHPSLTDPSRTKPRCYWKGVDRRIATTRFARRSATRAGPTRVRSASSPRRILSRRCGIRPGSSARRPTSGSFLSEASCTTSTPARSSKSPDVVGAAAHRAGSRPSFCRVRRARSTVATADNERWSLYGAPWATGGIGGKWNDRESGSNRREPLPLVATSCMSRSMVSSRGGRERPPP